MGKKKSGGALQQFLTDHRVMTYTNRDGVIDTLVLGKRETTDEVLGLLHELPSLRIIGLQDTQISDRGLAHLSKLSQLEELNLRSCKRISDAGMAHVSKLGKLKVLDLYDTEVGDKTVSHLNQLESLEKLDLHSTQVTDLGLKKLTKLTKLRSLEIGGKGLTDAALQYVGVLQHLEWLSLGESSFSDLGLAQLGRLTRLKNLSIAWTRITGLGFKHLASLTRLEWLFARKTQFSDKGLAYLAPLKMLKSLELSDTAVTDKGLKHLKGLEKLKDLALENTRVTKQGKADLKKSLPRCVILISADQGQVAIEQYGEEYFWSHPPRCVAGFTLKAMRSDRPTTYQLVCSCDGDAGTVLGFPLSEYNQDYQGRELVGPLAFLCARCRKTTEIIDTDIHGYNGEIGSSSTIRGHGNRIGYQCAKCASDKMTVLVEFSYEGGELDLKADEPSITVEDFFGSFLARGICVKCQAHVSIAEFECA